MIVPVVGKLVEVDKLGVLVKWGHNFDDIATL